MKKSHKSTSLPENQPQNDNAKLAKAILSDMDACGILDDLTGKGSEQVVEIQFSDSTEICCIAKNNPERRDRKEIL